MLFHALGAWRIKPAFHDILWNPAFVMPASQLLDGAVRFWHDQLFCKPARHGGVVAWHQDYSYWTRTQPMEHLTCWIALDDSTRDNGCLQYIPGSHRWPLLPITGLAGNMDEIQTVLSEEQRQQFQPVAIELKAGEATFHHPLMVHGSYENRTDRPRRATVINVFRDGVRSASDGELLQGVPPIPKGQKMEGQFFPFCRIGPFLWLSAGGFCRRFLLQMPVEETDHPLLRPFRIRAFEAVVRAFDRLDLRLHAGRLAAGRRSTPIARNSRSGPWSPESPASEPHPA